MAALQYTIGSGMNYPSLALAEAGTRQNLTSGGGNTLEILIQEAFQETRSGSGITFGTGWTTSATCTITITVPKAYRHTGSRGTGYRIVGDFDWGGTGLLTTLSYVTINGVSVRRTGDNMGFGISTGDLVNNVRNCFVADCDLVGIIINDGNAVNNMVVGCSVGIRANYGGWGGTDFTRAYNNTILNCTQGIDLGNGNGHLLLKNTCIGNSGNPSIAVEGGVLDTIVTSATSDEFTGTTTISVANCHFTSSTAGSEDLHIASTSYLCHGVNAGTDLHTGDTYYNFNTDFEDDSRPNSQWDIGADQYVSGSSTYDVSINETGTLSESQDSTATLLAAINETGILTDTPNSIAILLATINETGVLSDSQTGILTIPVSINETGTLSDTPNSTAVLLAAINETGILSDTQNSIAVLLAAINETGDLLEAQSSISTLLASINETGILSSSQDFISGPSNRIRTIGSGKNYPSITAALAGEDNFDTEFDLNIQFIIDAGEYGAFEIPAKFTPDSTHRLQFFCSTGSFHNFQRSTGVIIKNSTSYFTQGSHDPAYTEYYGIAFTIDNAVGGIDAALEFGYSNCLAFGCFAYDVYGSNGYNEGLIVTDRVVGAEYPKFINCAAVNCAGVGIGSQYLTVGVTDMVIDNCLVLNCGYGFRPSGGRTNYIKNCWGGGCSGGAYIDGGDTEPLTTFNITTCFSDDGSKSTSVISISDCHFTNSGVGTENINFTSLSHLIHTITSCTDLHEDSSLYAFNTDAYGVVRPNGLWDIGPIQFVNLNLFKPIIIMI